MSKRKRTSAKPRNGAGAGKRAHDVLALTFDTDAHRALDRHCSQDQQREVCGILVGFCGESGGQLWTRVVGVIEGKHAREEQMSVTFTHETWDAVHEALGARRDGAKVVGWYHTHPDFGIFFSSHDAFVHRNFFGTDGQIGVVVDPVRDQRGVFVSRAGQIVTLDRYEVARANASGHRMTCEYIGAPLRDSMPEATAAALEETSRLDAIEASLAVVSDRMLSVQRVLYLLVPAAAIVGLVCGLLLGGLVPRQRPVATGKPPVATGKPPVAVQPPQAEVGTEPK